jgi:hypothetical protein
MVSTVSTPTPAGEWLVLVSCRNHGLAWPAGASLGANDHAIQQQLAAPDAPWFAALKRTIQAGGPSRTVGAHPSGSRDATGIVGEEQLWCRAARQSLAGDVRPLDRSAVFVTSPSLTVRQTGHLPRNLQNQRTPPRPRGLSGPAMTEIRPKTPPPASAGIPTCPQHFGLRTGTATTRTPQGPCTPTQTVPFSAPVPYGF